jgi:hypothetical protein
MHVKNSYPRSFLGLHEKKFMGACSQVDNIKTDMRALS